MNLLAAIENNGYSLVPFANKNISFFPWDTGIRKMFIKL